MRFLQLWRLAYTAVGGRVRERRVDAPENAPPAPAHPHVVGGIPADGDFGARTTSPTTSGCMATPAEAARASQPAATSVMESPVAAFSLVLGIWSFNAVARPQPCKGEMLKPRLKAWVRSVL